MKTISFTPFIKRIFCFMFVVVSFTSSASAQVFWTEAFQNGCASACIASTYVGGPNGPWTITATGFNDPFPNKWYISGEECGNAAGICGSNCGATDPSLHIGADDGLLPPDPGAAYDNGSACTLAPLFICTTTDSRAESPTIDCSAHSNIVLGFNYIEEGQAGVDFCSLWYSANNGGAWSLLANMPPTANGGCGGQGLWTAYTVNLPASANLNPTVKIAFRWQNNTDGVGNDPSFAVDDITLATANTITTGTIFSGTYCSCDTVNVPFTSTGTFTANTYSAQLSDASGSFGVPVNMGNLASNLNSDVIPATIPCGTASGTHYRIRVVSNSPATTGTDNGVDITINQSLVAAVTIAMNPLMVCAGSQVTLTATNVNNIPSATYQWFLFGSPQGTGPTLVVSPNSGDNFFCNINSLAPCVTGTPASSNHIIIAYGPGYNAGVPSCTANPNPVCAGNNVTFTATNPGGTVQNPEYIWHLDTGAGFGVVGTDSTNYYNSTLNTGDQVFVELNSQDACCNNCPQQSATVVMTVNPSVQDSVTITVSSNPICSGTSVTFTATNVNNITTPTYQWTIGGSPVAGATSSTFVTSTLIDLDQVQCILSSLAACVNGSPATSNTIVMSVNSSLIAGASITSSAGDTVCLANPNSTFTVTPSNGGATPTYQWYLNGGPVAGATTTTYNNPALANGDQIYCEMTSSIGCATGNPANSNVIIMFVDPGGVATVTITATPPSPVCPGTSVTFSTTVTNSGSTPTFQWFLNGVLQVGATGATYTNTTLANGDVVSCTMVSSSQCATGSPATSNLLPMTVATTEVASVSITSDVATVCQGDPVTFTASPVFGGTPVYQWQVNGSPSGTSAATFTSTSLANGDSVRCVMISTDNCASGSPASSNAVFIVVNPCSPPVSNFVANTTTTVCEGGCVSFTDLSTGTPPITSWNWEFEGGNPPSSTDSVPPLICYPAEGTYYVKLQTANSRGTNEKNIVGYVKAIAPVALDAGSDVEIQLGTSTDLHATGGNSYMWSPPSGLSCTECADTKAAPTATTTYAVTDTVGCQGSDSVTVKVFKDFEIYVPTAFSPNGDGQNDVLYVRGNGIKEINFIIYDRLGEKVFTSLALDYGWDGSFRGRPMNSGVFSYYVKAFMFDGSEKSSKGNVTLFR